MSTRPAKRAKRKPKQPAADAQSGAAAVYMPPSFLHVWKDNPRANDGEPVRRVAASIKRFGFGAPIVARAANGEIIAGHTRYKAALLLKLAKVPVRMLELSEDEAHKLALADNRLGEFAEWSAGLATLLQQLKLEDALVLGWSQPDIDKVLAALPSVAQLAEDVAPRLDRPGKSHMEIECPNCKHSFTLRPVE